MKKRSKIDLAAFAIIRNTDTSAATEARERYADEFAIELGPRIPRYPDKEITGHGKIADQLVKDGISKRNGNTKWVKKDVARLLKRQAKLSVNTFNTFNTLDNFLS